MIPSRWAALPLAMALAACVAGPSRKGPVAPSVPSPAPPAAPAPEINAVALGVAPGLGVSSLAGLEAKADTALAAFRLSCPALLKRQDRSGLTRPQDWTAACAAADTASDAAVFFRDYFETAIVGDGAAFFTGYYEPEIGGSRVQSAASQVPIYRRPPDLVDVDLGAFSEELKGKRIRGRVQDQSLIPYHTRGEIEEGALAGRDLEIAWANDPIEFFFLQIQGSGRLNLPDGSVMRIGYAGQNGRDYVGIGKRLRAMDRLAPGQATMDGIISWLRANPAEGQALMRENKSYVFFRELNGPGPLGALGAAVTPRVTLAADPAFVPLGAPVWVDGPDLLDGLWVAQDTGGAIKGANRFDSFWGAGSDARKIAGGMSQSAKAFLLVPRGTLARLALQAQERLDAPSPQP